MKPAAYILILIFSFVSLGTSLFFFVSLSGVRTEMKTQLSEDRNLQCITFSQEDFSGLKWEKKNKEFRWEGKMYDVSKVEYNGDKILVYCIFDTGETDLRKTLAGLFNDKPGNHSPLRLWVKMLSQNYFTTPEFSLPVLHQDFTVVQSAYVFRIHSFENELADPPPRS